MYFFYIHIIKAKKESNFAIVSTPAQIIYVQDSV